MLCITSGDFKLSASSRGNRGSSRSFPFPPRSNLDRVAASRAISQRGSVLNAKFTVFFALGAWSLHTNDRSDALALCADAGILKFGCAICDQFKCRIFTILGPFLLSCLLLELWGAGGLHSFGCCVTHNALAKQLSITKDFATSRTYSSDYAGVLEGRLWISMLHGETGLETQQVYTTPCGCAVIAVDLALLAFYVFNVRTTLSQEVSRSKQSRFHVAMLCFGYARLQSGRADSYFYRRWGVAFGCWQGARMGSARTEHCIFLEISKVRSSALLCGTLQDPAGTVRRLHIVWRFLAQAEVVCRSPGWRPLKAQPAIPSSMCKLISVCTRGLKHRLIGTEPKSS